LTPHLYIQGLPFLQRLVMKKGLARSLTLIASARENKELFFAKEVDRAVKPLLLIFSVTRESGRCWGYSDDVA